MGGRRTQGAIAERTDGLFFGMPAGIWDFAAGRIFRRPRPFDFAQGGEPVEPRCRPTMGRGSDGHARVGPSFAKATGGQAAIKGRACSPSAPLFLQKNRHPDWFPVDKGMLPCALCEIPLP